MFLMIDRYVNDKPMECGFSREIMHMLYVCFKEMMPIQTVHSE